MEKKTYDIIRQHHGYKAMRHGWHEKVYALVKGSASSFPKEEYTTLELPLCFWRVRNTELESKLFKKELARTIEHQQKHLS